MAENEQITWNVLVHTHIRIKLAYQHCSGLMNFCSCLCNCFILSLFKIWGEFIQNVIYQIFDQCKKFFVKCERSCITKLFKMYFLHKDLFSRCQVENLFPVCHVNRFYIWIKWLVIYLAKTTAVGSFSLLFSLMTNYNMFDKLRYVSSSLQ